MKNYPRRILAVVIIVLLILASLLVVVFVGEPEQDKKVVIILKSEQYSEFWREVISGVEKGAENRRVSFDIVGAIDENDVNGQMELIRRTIEEKPDGIMLAASDHFRIGPLAKEIQDSGIKLVLVDSGVQGEAYDSFVATENYMAGYKAGVELADMVNEPEYIVVVNHVQGALTAIEREQGFKDAMLSAHPDVTVGVFYSNDKVDAASRYVSQLIQYGIQIDGIVALNEISSIGAANALNDFYERMDIPMVGMDSSITEIQYLEKGIIDTLIVQQPFNMGYTAMTTLLDSIDNKEVKSRIDTGSRVINRENMYDEVNQMLLFPFED